MVQSNIELEFKPEVHVLCYLLDAPILLSIAVGSYVLGNIFNFMPTQMLILTFGSLVLWLLKFIKFNRACDETEVTVYVDRIDTPVRDVIPVLARKIFDDVLVLHDCERAETVTEAGGFFKIEGGGGFFHFDGDFYDRFVAFSLK